MRIKDYIFEITKYDRPDFEGYKGEINVSINLLNTNYFVKGQKYVKRAETLKEVKNWLKENNIVIQKSIKDK